MNKKLMSIFLMIAMLLSLGSSSIFAEVIKDENTTVILEQNGKKDNDVNYVSRSKLKNTIIVGLAIAGAYCLGYFVSYANQPTIVKIYQVASKSTIADIGSFTLWGVKYIGSELYSGLNYGAKEIVDGLFYGAKEACNGAKAVCQWSQSSIQCMG